jgi:hypothetical protein
MKLTLRGHFLVRGYNPDGSLAWSEVVRNGPTLAGLTYLLSAAFGGGSQLPNWAVGLIDAAGFTGISTSDVMTSHLGWVEATQYSEGTRRGWSGLTINNGVANNPALIAFTFNAARTLQGLFVVSDNTKGGTSGTLWATALFAAPKIMSVGQSLTITYIIQAAGGT